MLFYWAYSLSNQILLDSMIANFWFTPEFTPKGIGDK